MPIVLPGVVSIAYGWSAFLASGTFSSAYTGNIELYAVDWDHVGRRETISAGGQSASLTSDFSNGAWITIPVNQAAGSTLTITVTNNGPVNAVLSGIFLN